MVQKMLTTYYIKNVTTTINENDGTLNVVITSPSDSTALLFNLLFGYSVQLQGIILQNIQ